jgi:hypothetical protein
MKFGPQNVRILYRAGSLNKEGSKLEKFKLDLVLKVLVP